MIMPNYLYITLAVLIMALVTYIPRAIPISFMKREIKNRYIKSFLFYVPYAVIAAIIFPSILYFTSNIIVAGLGALVALVLSFFRQKLYVVALVSVLTVYGLLWLFSVLGW